MDGANTNGIEHVESLSPAEELLVSFLAKRAPHDGERGIDALCAQHPGLEGDLRRLYAEWSRLDRVLGARGASQPLEQRLDHATTPPIDAAALDELVARLDEHSAKRVRYEVEAELARGGMGIVYKVWDPDLRRHVAMKVLRKRRGKLRERERGHEERMLGRFLEEAQITGQLEHPGIVPVHEIGVDENSKLYFTMPLVRGRELKEVIELARGECEGWNLTRALGVLLKVCEAVAYAHSKGVVHRDLKPSNVMVGRFGETYVMDWGLARVMGKADRRDIRLRPLDAGAPPSELVETDIRSRLESTPDSPLITLDGAVIGTPAYMAPEQAEGRVEEVGPRADVYAIGAMLYHLLTGQMPYVPSGSPISPHTVLAARILGPPKPVQSLAPEAPAELAAVCEKAMNVDPSKRYEGALDLAADLEAYLGSRPVSAFDSSLWHVLKLAFRRHKRAALVAAGVVALALAWGVRDVVTSRRHATHASVLQSAAEAAEARTRRAADFASAQVLRQQASELYPATPERVPAMRQWLERVDDLLSRAPGYRDEARASSDVELATCVADLGLLAAERPIVAERAALAAGLVERTLDAHRDRWSEAIESIASLAVYGGLKLAPQRGLIPLQLDPQSGLWEFWVDGTGVEPKVASATTGRVDFEPDSALVLVLIPGGEFTSCVREQRTDSTWFDRVRTLKLDPYFIGRTEVPQSVWQRVMRSNPAQYQPPTMPASDYAPQLPVEYVDWDQCATFLARTDLVFPTEAQWERAARGGEATPTLYGVGDDPAQLEDRENVHDQTIPASARSASAAPFLDGYELTAPIARFEPNGFGLHDVIGNVAEWCADPFVASVPETTARGDGLVESEGARFRAFRGGSFYQPPQNCRLTLRQHDLPVGANQTRGLRVARPVR